MRVLWISAVIGLIAASSMAQAQAPGDWEYLTDARTRTAVAALPTTTGVTVAVRCTDGGLEVLMTGLSPAEAENRTIGIGFGESPISDQTWSVATDDTVAISRLPAPFARKLREGGTLQVRLAGAGEGGRNIRYVIDLPPSQTAIDQILTACGRPLVDPRDAELDAVGEDGLPSNLEWLRQPRPRYPANMKYAKGFAVVTCVAATDGGLRDCVVETEHPHDGKFGEAIMDAVGDARLVNTLNPDAPIDPSRVVFTTNFYMSGYQPRSPRTGTRIPNRN